MTSDLKMPFTKKVDGNSTIEDQRLNTNEVKFQNYVDDEMSI